LFSQSPSVAIIGLFIQNNPTLESFYKLYPEKQVWKILVPGSSGIQNPGSGPMNKLCFFYMLEAGLTSSVPAV
jgi:hypothetical protein